MAEMTMETVKGFLLKEGSIGVVDHGVARLLHSELAPEYLNLALKADWLWFDKVWFSREDFALLCKQLRVQRQAASHEPAVAVLAAV
jgi:hypothetical protein